MKLFKKAKKGFTLVELIVVIAIVAILAAVSVAGYYGFIESAKQSRADQEAAQAKLVLQAAFTPAGDVVVTENPLAERSYSWTKNGIKAPAAESANVILDFTKVLKDKGGLDEAKFSLDSVVFGTGDYALFVQKIDYKVTETVKTSTINFLA